MTTSIYSGAFWKSSTERAAKTAIQTFIPLGGGAAFNLLGIDWSITGAAVGSAVVLSYLASLLSGLNGTGPSAVSSEIKADAVVLDEVELNAVEAQKILDQMVIEDEVPDEDDAPEDDDTVDEVPLTDDVPPDAETDDTPVPDDYEPRH